MDFRQRFLVPMDATDPAAVAIGYLLLVKECVRLGTDGLILVPQLRNVSWPVLEQALGLVDARHLKAARSIVVDNTHQIQIASAQTVSRSERAGVVLALWATKYSIEDAESLPHCLVLVVLPGLPEETIEWRRCHAVKTIAAQI